MPSASVTRYQRFLEEELGQLLYSQWPHHSNGQLPQVEGQPAQCNTQHNQLNGQNPCLDWLNASSDGQHGYNSSSDLSQATLNHGPSNGGRSGSWTAQPDQLIPAQHLTQDHLLSGSAAPQNLSAFSAQLRSANSKSVSGSRFRQHYRAAGAHTDTWTEPQPGLSAQPGTLNGQGLASLNSPYTSGPTGRPEGVAAASQSLGEEDEGRTGHVKKQKGGTVELSRRVMNGSRASSPLGRQLMLQSRLGLLDSDSSSSDDDAEESSQRVSRVSKFSMTGKNLVATLMQG